MPKDRDNSGLLPALEPDDEPARLEPVGLPPPPESGVPRGALPSPGSLGGSLARDTGDLSLVDLDGEVRESRPQAPPGFEESQRAVESQGPTGEEVLELDLDKAGLADKPPKGGMFAPGEVAEGIKSDADAAPTAGGTDHATPPAAPSAPSAARVPSSPPLPESVRVLGADLPAAAMLAIAVGLGVGLVVANMGSRRAEREVLAPLHTELEQSVSRPLAARAGELRTPSQVRADLETKHEDIRTSFFMTWILAGLPIAGGLLLIKRRA